MTFATRIDNPPSTDDIDRRFPRQQFDELHDNRGRRLATSDDTCLNWLPSFSPVVREVGNAFLAVWQPKITPIKEPVRAAFDLKLLLRRTRACNDQTVCLKAVSRTKAEPPASTLNRYVADLLLLNPKAYFVGNPLKIVSPVSVRGWWLASVHPVRVVLGWMCDPERRP